MRNSPPNRLSGSGRDGCFWPARSPLSRAQPIRAASASRPHDCSRRRAPRSPSSISTARAAQHAAAELGTEHRGFACDVTDPTACKEAARGVLGAFGQVDILINNAGITQPVKIMDITPADLQRILDVNLRRRALSQPGLHPAHARAQAGLDRLHVVGVGPAWRRHLRRAALLRRQGRRARSRQGHGARARAGRHSGELRDARPDPDRHHGRQAHRRDAAGDSQGHPARAGSATPRMWPASICFSRPTCPPTSRAPSSTSTAAC